MRCIQLYLLIGLAFINITVIAAELHEQLQYFETLKVVDVKVRKKRSLDSHTSFTKDVTFSAFGRDFNLILTPGSPVISSDLAVKLVYRDGRTSPLYINENNFYTGHLTDDETVKVDAHEEDGVWGLNIYDKNDTYTLEPSWRHLPPSDNHSMIVYRHSDVKWNNTFPESDTKHSLLNFCGAVHPEDDPDVKLDEQTPKDERYSFTRNNNEEGQSRSKRSSWTLNTCHIIAVADYTFFMGPGGGFPHQTANYIVQTMQKVNAIFKNTVWDEDRQIKDLGFHIKEMRIHTEYTDPSQYHSNNKHYNMDQSYWPDQELLAQFGHDKYFTNFCLAHLFTHRTFDKNVVGMAYIASSRKFTPWGICAKLGSNNIAFNTGLSSTMNTMGNNMLTQEAVLVTAHEFGHSWGAEHDADTRECAPLNKGRYLMFMFATSGFEENNDDFSPCSKRYVTEVLLANAGSCFKENEQEGLEPKVPMCGNGVIDKGEMCDSGGFGISGMDPCCDSQCRLQENATCSPVNSECCKNCTMAPRGMVCRGASKEQCLQSAICSGFSFDCPASTPMPDTPEVKCIDEGVCKGGRCQSYCQRHLADSVPCICTTPGEECLRCCQEQDQVCQKINASHFLTDGRPCSYGYCKAGVCIGVRANMVQRLFAFIEKLTPNTLVAFMKSNIVGTIIVFSLVIWVPASWTVSCLDKKRGKLNRKYQDQWVSSETLLNRSFQSSVFANSVDNYKVKDTGPWPTYHGASSNVYLPPSPDEKKNKLPPLIMPPEKYFETTFKFNDHSGRPNESVVWETVM